MNDSKNYRKKLSLDFFEQAYARIRRMDEGLARSIATLVAHNISEQIRTDQIEPFQHSNTFEFCKEAIQAELYRVKTAHSITDNKAYNDAYDAMLPSAQAA